MARADAELVQQVVAAVHVRWSLGLGMKVKEVIALDRHGTAHVLEVVHVDARTPSERERDKRANGKK